MKFFGIEIDFSPPPRDDEAYQGYCWSRYQEIGVIEDALLEAIEDYPDDADYPQMLEHVQQNQESSGGGFLGWLFG